MTDATTVKCPTCGRPRGAACIRLSLTPAGQIVWSGSHPHDARTAKVHGR